MTDTIPAQYIIKGVPFVSWREAARFEYEDKDISNPSTKACALMLVGFLGPGCPV
ncbi:MAG: hypothetical protein KAS54_04135 [Dehalococcoidia bacterium]|jgi:hypothetical protein|nr:hypothetical protein [Dehalococcoidia bacterium]